MEPSIRDGKPIHVLFVEDEFFLSEWVAESLSEQGFAVEAVCNAEDALRHLTLGPVDVLLTDINLPGDMDGIALARRARELLPGLPIVYASGDAAALDPCKRLPGSAAMLKPYVPAKVGQLLAGVVNPAAELVPA